MVEVAEKGGSQGKGRVTVKAWRGRKETQETSWFQGKKVHNGTCTGPRSKVTEKEDLLRPAQADTTRGVQLGLHVGAVAVGTVAAGTVAAAEGVRRVCKSPRGRFSPHLQTKDESSAGHKQELPEDGLAGPTNTKTPGKD